MSPVRRVYCGRERSFSCPSAALIRERTISNSRVDIFPTFTLTLMLTLLLTFSGRKPSRQPFSNADRFHLAMQPLGYGVGPLVYHMAQDASALTFDPPFAVRQLIALGTVAFRDQHHPIHQRAQNHGVLGFSQRGAIDQDVAVLAPKLFQINAQPRLQTAPLVVTPMGQALVPQLRGAPRF